MKKLFKFACALLAGLAVFACDNQFEDEIKFCTEISTNVTELAQFAAENATEQTIEVTADGQWMAIAPAWVEVKPNVGYSGKTTVTVKALDNKETVENEAGEMVTELGPQRSATIAFTGEGEAKAEVALTQAGDPNKWDPAKPRPVTMKYFNEVATTGDGFIYELTGKIVEVANTLYGNFYFEDETGRAYVYGLVTPEGEQKVQWAAAGLKMNDIITVRGARSDYKGDPQMSNAVYVSHEVGEDNPVITTTIGGIDKAGDYIVEEAVVIASYARGFLAGDETGKILVYLNKEAEVVVGDKVKLEGAVTSYAGLLQFGSDTVVTKVGEGATVEHGEPVVMDVAALEAYLEAPAIQYASYVGTLSITENDKGSKYYNVIFDDTEKAQGSISYPTMDLTEFNGKKVTVTGYTIGVSSGKFVNTMVVNVTEVEKVETNFGEKTYEFLKAIVDGKMLGDATPEIEDWTSVTAEFPGITLAEIEGKLEITSIDGAPLTALPNTISLPELVRFNVNSNKAFEGKEFPAVWNTPKLEYVNIAVCGFTGTFPKSFAENTPAMHTLFMNDNQFKGAWPHTWASGVNGGTGKLECLISIPGNDKMGYMVPATMDVKLNAYNADGSLNNPSRDKTQIKIGGADADPAQYIGFEKGWGQERYVKYGEGAADDLTTWNAHRLLTENGDEWAWFFSNLPGKIPTALYDWDQAAADAFTADGTLPDPNVDNSVTIAHIIENGAGTYEVKDATVVAVTTKGILLNDGTGYIYHYQNAAPSVVVGDIVKVKGEVEIRYSMHQFKSSATAEKTGHNDSFAQPTPEVIDATALDAYMNAPVYKYVEVTGILEAGQYINLVVEGTENTASVSYCPEANALKALNGHSLTLYGYFGGSNVGSKYATFYLVSYTDNGLVVEPEVGGEITEFGSYVWTMASGDISEGQLVKGEPKITWTSTAAPYIGWDNNNGKGVQIGSGSKPANSFTLSTEAVKVNIEKIIVNASVANSGDGKLTVKVGDKVCLDGQALTTTATDYTVAVGATGKVEISLGATAKAMYLKSITIVTAEYVEPEEPEVLIGEGTKAFLQAIVDGNLMGESTPAVDDWKHLDEHFPGITINEIGGKLEIVRIDGVPFVGLPNEVKLPELVHWNTSSNTGLNGKTFSTTWDTPKLEYVNIAVCGLVGTFPASFAANTPALHTLFMNDNNFEGAWPHFWASGVNGGTGKLECMISIAGNAKMGYMVPATLDVKLNAWKDGNKENGHANPSRDLTQIKIAGADANPAQYVGFEKGWGQERYVTYGGGTANDLTTWNEHRLLVDEWAWYFSNLPGSIPQVLLEWDQAAADAYTASGVLPDLSQPEEGGVHEGFN